ncbi:MAG: GntR family transcriptional regulator [Candidatus Ratteibacteria bacterium]
MTLYERVKEYLLAEIEKREEGDILPSQTYLVQKFKVCHLTIRRALEDLEKEGLILKRQGKGTFIRKKSQAFSIQLCTVPICQEQNKLEFKNS